MKAPKEWFKDGFMWGVGMAFGLATTAFILELIFKIKHPLLCFLLLVVFAIAMPWAEALWKDPEPYKITLRKRK